MKKLRAELVKMPAKIYAAGLVYVDAKQALQAAEREHQRAAATSYIGHHDQEKQHSKANHHVMRDPIVWKVRLDREAAEVKATRAWLELERLRNLFGLSKMLYVDRDQDGPPGASAVRSRINEGSDDEFGGPGR